MIQVNDVKQDKTDFKQEKNELTYYEFQLELQLPNFHYTKIMQKNSTVQQFYLRWRSSEETYDLF